VKPAVVLHTKTVALLTSTENNYFSSKETSKLFDGSE